MKFLFNFVSLLVLIAYCLYNDGAKINQQTKLKAAVEKIVTISSVDLKKDKK